MSREGIGMLQNNKPRPGSRQQAIVTGLILIAVGLSQLVSGLAGPDRADDSHSADEQRPR